MYLVYFILKPKEATQSVASLILRTANINGKKQEDI